MSMGNGATRIYDNVAPAMVVPDHFFCDQSSKIVVVYNEPLGNEVDGVTLMFPGDMPTSSPKRVVPRRIGDRTLVFDTPVYSANRGMVKVLPLLNLKSGEVELAPFQIGIKHPVRNVMELCLNLSSNDAVLPVLIALMVHCEHQHGREQFQDPHIDRIMATLVGSRIPGATTSIKDILLPGKKWQRMTLADFSREFRLTETEKQAYMLKTERLRWVKRRNKITSLKATNTPNYENVVIPDDLPGTVSSPDIPGMMREDDQVFELMNQEHTLYRAVENHENFSDPEMLAFKIGQDVQVIHKSVNGWWYGESEGKRGRFPSRCVKTIWKTQHKRTASEDFLASKDSRTSLASLDRPGGQPISADELRNLPIPTYGNLGRIPNTTDSESDSQAENSPSLARKLPVFPKRALAWQTDAKMSESTDSGLDRMQVLPSANPLEVPRRFGPAFSHHHQDLTPPKSPLTTRHMHSPGAHHHHWVSGDTSSGSAEEKQHKAPPQKKPPMLPPKHTHGTHGHKYLPQDRPQEQTAFPPKRPPIPKPRTKKPEKSASFKEQPEKTFNQYFEEPEYDDTVSIKPSNRPLRKSAPLPVKELEKQSGTNEQVDIVGDHVYDLPDQWTKIPPRDVPRKRPIAPPQLGPKPLRGHLHGDSPQNTFNGGSELLQPGAEILGAQHQAKGRLGRQVHFAVSGTSENDSSDKSRHQSFEFMQTHV